MPIPFANRRGPRSSTKSGTLGGKSTVAAPLGRRLILLGLRRTEMPEGSESAKELPQARLARQPPAATCGALADRAGLPLGLGGVLRPHLLLHRHSVPSSSSTCFAAASCHSAPPQGFRASSLARELSPALRPHLRQAQVHGTRPFLEGTVPGSGHGPTGRRSCRPSAGAWLRKTTSMASWRLGISHSFACPSRPHGGKTGEPAPSATPRLLSARRSSAALALGRFLFCPCGRIRRGKAGWCRLRSLTVPPSAVRVRA